MVLDSCLDFFCFYSDQPTKNLLQKLKLKNKESENPSKIFLKIADNYQAGVLRQEYNLAQEIVKKFLFENDLMVDNIKENLSNGVIKNIPFLVFWLENNLFEVRKDEKVSHIKEKNPEQNSLHMNRKHEI